MARLDQIAFLKDAGIDLAPFETRCRWRRFDTDEILVDFDDVSTDVYLILAGEVRILIRTQSGKEVILGEMRGGQMFGELAAIDGVSRSANVTALTRGEVCVMTASVFREIVFAAPAIADRLAAEVVSLPMHPYLAEEVQDRIARAVREALIRQRRVAAE